MSVRKKIQKWGAVPVGAVCVLLFFNIISDLAKNPAAADPATAVSATASSAKTRKSADPKFQLAALKELPNSPLPANSRDPFQFVTEAPPAQSAAKGGHAGPYSIGASAGAGAPERPKLTIQALGYGVRSGGTGEAYLSDDDRVYVVHKGDVVNKRYTILQITQSTVEVLDGTTGETANITIPPAQ